MCIINLKNNFFVEAKSTGYTLKKRNIRVVNGNIKESVKKYGYYGQLSLAIEYYIKLLRDELLDSETVELREYARLSDQCAKLAVDGLQIHKLGRRIYYDRL